MVKISLFFRFYILVALKWYVGFCNFVKHSVYSSRAILRKAPCFVDSNLKWVEHPAGVRRITHSFFLCNITLMQNSNKVFLRRKPGWQIVETSTEAQGARQNYFLFTLGIIGGRNR